MEYISLIITVTFIHLLALIIPGPDFIMAVKNSLIHSRKIGVWTAIGFSLGILTHIIYCIAGLAVIISRSILLFNTIKYLGAGYLIYIGIKSIFFKTLKITIKENKKDENLSVFSAIRMGFLTNILNPKVTLFFLSIFTMVISPGTPLFVLLILSLVMVFNTALWFSLVSIFFTQKKVMFIYEKYNGFFTKIFGSLLVLLGLKVATVQK